MMNVRRDFSLEQLWTEELDGGTRQLWSLAHLLTLDFSVELCVFSFPFFSFSFSRRRRSAFGARTSPFGQLAARHSRAHTGCALSLSLAFSSFPFRVNFRAPPCETRCVAWLPIPRCHSEPLLFGHRFRVRAHARRIASQRDRARRCRQRCDPLNVVLLFTQALSTLHNPRH